MRHSANRKQKRCLLWLLVLQDWTLMSAHPCVTFWDDKGWVSTCTYSVQTGLGQTEEALFWQFYLHYLFFYTIQNNRFRRDNINAGTKTQLTSTRLLHTCSCTCSDCSTSTCVVPDRLVVSPVLLCSRSPWAATINSITCWMYLLPVASFQLCLWPLRK